MIPMFRVRSKGTDRMALFAGIVLVVWPAGQATFQTVMGLRGLSALLRDYQR
jgi:hypothetical protein